MCTDYHKWDLYLVGNCIYLVLYLAHSYNFRKTENLIHENCNFGELYFIYFMITNAVKDVLEYLMFVFLCFQKYEDSFF